MSILYRGPSIDASYQVSLHLAKRFQRRRFFLNLAIRNKNCMWRPCLQTSNKFHLAKGFQRRRLKCEKLTDDRRRTPSDGKSSRCLWQGELKSKFHIFVELCLNVKPSIHTQWLVHIPETTAAPKLLAVFIPAPVIGTCKMA